MANVVLEVSLSFYGNQEPIAAGRHNESGALLGLQIPIQLRNNLALILPLSAPLQLPPPESSPNRNRTKHRPMGSIVDGKSWRWGPSVDNNKHTTQSLEQLSCVTIVQPQHLIRGNWFKLKAFKVCISLLCWIMKNTGHHHSRAAGGKRAFLKYLLSFYLFCFVSGTSHD